MAVKTVLAPIPGIFYRSPSPGEPPFKQDGDSVAAGETIGLIEVMKTFNPVEADRAGTLTALYVTDSQPVEFGEPLALIE